MAKQFSSGSYKKASLPKNDDNVDISVKSDEDSVKDDVKPVVKEVSPKKPKNKKKRVGVVIMVFLILITLGLFGAFLYMEYEDVIVEHKWDGVKDLALGDAASGSSTDGDEEKSAMSRNVLFDDLWKVNKDIIAWIYIPHTNVDYPILKEKKVGEYYYLHRDVYKNYDSNGCILTPKIQDDAEDMHFLVFGHHMNSGAMFGNLRDEFYSKSGYNKHKYIYVYWPDRTEKWDVWSAYDTDVNDMIYDMPYERGSKYYTKLLKHIDGRKNYSTDRKLKTINNLTHTMTLSTCRGAAGGDLRFTVSCTLNNVKWLNDKARQKYENSEREKNQELTATPTPKPTPVQTERPQPTPAPQIQTPKPNAGNSGSSVIGTADDGFVISG